MKRLLISAFLAGGAAATASPFPWWFHTRPKPVYFTGNSQQDRRTKPAAKRAPPQRTAVSSPFGQSATATGSAEQAPVAARPNRTSGRR